MDRKTIIGLTLIVLIVVVMTIVTMPSKEAREKQKAALKHKQDSIALVERQKHIADSVAEVQKNQKPVIDTMALLQKDTTLNQLPDSLRRQKLDSLEQVQIAEAYGPFRDHGVGELKFTTIETDKYVLTFVNQGARLYSVKLKGYQTYKKRYEEKITDTLDLMVGNESGFELALSCDGKLIRTSELFFELQESPEAKLTGDAQKILHWRAYANGNKQQYIEFTYTIGGNSYLVDFDITLQGLNKVIDPNQNTLPITWLVTAPSQERRADMERERCKIFYRTADGEVNSFGNKKKKIEYDLKWISFKQQFFSTVLIADGSFTNNPFSAQIQRFPKTELDRTDMYQAEMNIPYGYTPSETFGMQYFMGPNQYNDLKTYGLGLEKQISLGQFFLLTWVNRYLVIPVFNFFDSRHLGYGLIILLLTLIIKLITSPVTYRTFVSSAKMRILKPDIDELGKKFKQGEELQKQQAVMQLYRRAGVSPLAGCIPALLQMPILLAMFSFFPAAIELRQQSLFWANDLSTYDSIMQLPFNIPAYGSHVSLFTLLMTATTLLYTWMSSSQMTATGGAQAQQMKIMMFLMPIIFLGVLNSYSAALSYYYFLSNVISILLTLLIRKFFVNEEKLRAVIEENKKRPAKKKSKWAQRLEEMQKLREEQVRQQQKQQPKKKK